MASKTSKLEHWRSFFSGSNTGIFEIIEYAIAVAASDFPKEFKLRRDRIAERLFCCRLTRCLGCDHIELAVPEEEEDGGELKGEFGCEDGGCRAARSAAKESGVNSCSNGPALEMNQFSNYSFIEAEALTDEIEERNQTVEEVLRIKDVLDNRGDESDGVLYEFLRRLQLMQLSVEALKVTEIGKTVNGLRKHGSKQIRHLVRTLINEWKNVVDEWVSASAAIAGKSPDSVNHSALEDEGLPSPPLDEGAFLVAPTTTLELSQFFDGMDDDGNIQDIDCSLKAPVPERPHPRRDPHMRFESDLQIGSKENQIVERYDQVKKQTNIVNSRVEPGKPLKHASHTAKLEQVSGFEKKQASQVRNESKQKVSSNPVQLGLDRKPPSRSFETSKNSEEMSVHLKLEASKRKLHEGYQQAENAKKQRTIQVMELHDLPKQSLANRNFHPKHGNFNRHFFNGRR